MYIYICIKGIVRQVGYWNYIFNIDEFQIQL